MGMNGKTEPTSSRIDKLVYYYLQTAEQIEKIEERHKKELAKPKAFLEKLSGMLLEILDRTGTDMARTKKGTVSARVRDTASLADPTSFMHYVREHDAWELMDRRANGTACREYAKAHGALPPGVKINSMRYISVRTPTRKTELVGE